MVEITQRPEPPAAADALEWERYNALNLSDDHFDLMEPSKFAVSVAGAARIHRRARSDEAGWRSADRAAPSQQGHLRRLRLRAGRHPGPFADRHGAERQARRLPGFRAYHDRHRAKLGHSRRAMSPAICITAARARTAPTQDATHAWVEAYLPSLGWLGFDPTNDIEAGERHIRAAVGRDYADVPPTRGTFKGDAESELAISVSVEPTQAPVRHEDFLRVARPLKQPGPGDTAAGAALSPAATTTTVAACDSTSLPKRHPRGVASCSPS